jgi:hypothetical protein
MLFLDPLLALLIGYTTRLVCSIVRNLVPLLMLSGWHLQAEAHSDSDDGFVSVPKKSSTSEPQPQPEAATLPLSRIILAIESGSTDTAGGTCKEADRLI